jgi:acetyltransferase-like isoleucine patch superfamily enzyme
MFKKTTQRYFQKLRIKLFEYLSSSAIKLEGVPIKAQPVQMEGKGIIKFGTNVRLGYFPSPFFYDGSIYLECRNKEAIIEFGNNIFSNNNLKIICDRTRIEIGNDVLIGTNVEIIDSDFHEIAPSRRNSGNHICLPVHIGTNVFIGSNVKIFKGVKIGENSIIANSAIITKSFPANVIIAGNPGKIVSTILI